MEQRNTSSITDLTRQPAPFTTEDLYEVKNIHSPKFSPDGKKIVAVITQYEKELNDFTDTIVLIDPATGKIEPLGPGGAPAWSPDGRWIAFEGGDEHHSGIYIYNLEKGHKQFLATIYHS